ncbi:hypothetical protein [Paludisphaera sp.]|uniref:hypothetical protein n=1 Tax=Paludisphaera sp. TaxID=2017432 RepID=UPI00301B9B66
MDAATFVQAKFISNDPIYLLVPVLWLAMSVVNYFLFDAGKDAASKRKCYPQSVRLNAVFFVVVVTVFTVRENGPLVGLWMLVILVPGTLMISSMILHSTKFCDQCDSLVRSQYGSTAPVTCQNCGALLGECPDLPDEL